MARATPSQLLAKRQLQRSQARLRVAAIVLALAFAAVGVRLVGIALSDAAPIPRVLAEQAPELTRPDFVDRHGVMLATNIPIDALYADARLIADPRKVAADLAATLPDLDAAVLAQRLGSGASFVYIKRDLTPRQFVAVRALGEPGLKFERQMKRVYPNGQTAAHVLGFVDIDNHGLAGLEGGLDAQLRDPARGGGPVQLSLDLRVQHVVEDELRAAIAHFQAVGGVGLVTDVHSGEIIAMASLPDFDPNQPSGAPAAARFNQATLGVYEMGSTFKTFTMALALDQRLASLTTPLDARQPIRVGRHRIDDFKPQRRIMSLEEVFVRSSNIGTAQLARMAGEARMKAFLDQLGLFDPVRLEVLERGRPTVPQRWGEARTLTVSFGHGLSVTPVQLAAAIAAMANGGLYVPPTVLKRAPDAPVGARRVISEATSADIRHLLRAAVTGGAGLADVPGYPVGGKTGTAQKNRNGIYIPGLRISSFVGVFPAAAPRYLVFVMLDEPKPVEGTHGYATGGWTAAPTTSKIVARIAPILGLPPEIMANPQIADDPATRLATAGEGRRP